MIVSLLILLIGFGLLMIVPNTMKERVNTLLITGLLILVVVTFIIFAIYLLKNNPKESCLLKGVDDIQTIKNDKVDYHPILQQKPYVYCPECYSYRLVELYWYRRYLAEHNIEDRKSNDNIVNLPKIFTDDEKKFVGCLYCQQTFKIKMDSKKEWIETLIILALVLIGNFLLPVFINYLDILNLKSYFILLIIVLIIYAFLSFSTKPTNDYFEKISFN